MKWLSFPGTLALKNPEQWLSTTGQVAQPGAENPQKTGWMQVTEAYEFLYELLR